MCVCVCVNRLAMHEESSSRRKVDDDVHEGAVPSYLLDRDNTTRAKVCVFYLYLELEKLICLHFLVFGCLT